MRKIVIIYKDSLSCSFTFKDEANACQFFNSVMNGCCNRNDIAQVKIINMDIKF